MSLQRLWAYERSTFCALDLDREPPPVVALPSASFAEARRDAVASLAVAMGLPCAEVAGRFDAGSRCFVAWVEGAIASYGWVSWGTERIGELERSMRMQPDEAYIWDCATLPPYRRRGLYSALLRYIASALRAQGIRRVWIGASLSNRPSIQGFAAAGFQPALRLTYLRVWRARGFWVRDVMDAPPGLAAAARYALIESREAAAPPSTPRGSATLRSAAEENCL